jgi:hypothetical protein
VLYVALSALQGRPMASAFDELAALGCAIQLTPGNLPTPAFAERVAASGVATRRHHGFAFDARKTAVWRDGACVVEAESVHPPELAREPGDWWSWYLAAEVRPIVEVMYPGYALGSGDEVEHAMAEQLPLAVDVSHVHIQLAQGAMHERTWRQLQAYEHIAEVHVSANDGRYDTHRVVRADTFGLAWVRDRLAGGDHVVLECYMHKLSDGERRAQIDAVREAA